MNLEPRVGVEPTTCRLLHLRYLAVSSSFSLRLPFPFSTVFGRNCSQVVPKFVADITSFLRRPCDVRYCGILATQFMEPKSVRNGCVATKICRLPLSFRDVSEGTSHHHA